MERPRLTVDFYQLADDALFKEHRTDGTGWDWCWADWQRDWMNATPNRHAYRCLPLTIVNQTGWWVKNPVGFSASWSGSPAPGSIDFRFDGSGELWKGWINSQFGEGIITWNTPFFIRTQPAGSRLLICGPANYFRKNAHPLTALIESDWMSMSFTMNYKVMIPGDPVRFEAGEPLFQAIPLISNACADLESAEVRYQKLADDPEVHRAYSEWSRSRSEFHAAKAKGDVKPDQWQKDYFQGRSVSGAGTATDHMTKVKPPRIVVQQAPAPALVNEAVKVAACPAAHGQPVVQTSHVHAGPGPIRGGSVPEPQRTGAGRPMETIAQAPRRDAGANGVGDVAAANGSAVAAEANGGVRVNDEWRRWIAENLMLDSGPEGMLGAMVAAGISRDEAIREIELAAESPYLKGAEQLRNRLRKRDWLLATYRKINRLDPDSGAIPRRHRLSRVEFLKEYYSTNRPVIITGMMDDWPAMTKWNLDYFAEKFGDREIEVQFGRNAGANYEIEREKFLKDLKLGEFVEMVRSAGNTNDFYLTAYNNSKNKAALAEIWQDVVQIPEYLDGRDPASGFFWMGPAGTITPFHHDLTNNFMAQVIGRKKVKVVPSWDMPLMENHYHVYSRVDGRTAPPRPQARQDEAQILECVLGPGEILFLPIGCLHYVEGIDVSVTVSFTNFAFDNDFASFYTTYHRV